MADVRTVIVAIPTEQQFADCEQAAQVGKWMADTAIQYTHSMLYRCLAGIHPIYDPDPHALEMMGEELETILEKGMNWNQPPTSVVRWTRE